SIVGNTAQRLLVPELGIVEHFEARAEGVALTWVLPKSLPGLDALCVEAEVTGLAYAGQTENGHHFADEEGNARLRVGKATAVDTRGRKWGLGISRESNRLRVQVPKTVLAEAVYPLAIDPLISAEFEMDQPVFDPPPLTQSAPAIASNGSEFLVVWID